MIRLYMVLTSILFFLACHQHVQLQAPPPASAPVEERIQAYQQLKPLVHREIYTINSYYGAASMSSSLTLVNGIKVHHPEDLITVVGSDTQFSQYALKSVEQKNTGNILMGTGFGVELLGCGIMFAGIPNSVTNQDYTTFGIGTGIVIAGFAAFLAGYYFSAKAEDSASSAFDIYDQALLQRLDLKRPSHSTDLIPAH